MLIGNMKGSLAYPFIMYMGSIIAKAESLTKNRSSTRDVCGLRETEIYYIRGEQIQIYAWTLQNVTSCRMDFHPIPYTDHRVCVCTNPVQLPWNGEIYTHNGIYPMTYMTLILYNRGNKAVCSRHGQPMRFRILKEAFYHSTVVELYVFAQSQTDITVIMVTMVILVSCLGVCILFGCVFFIWKLNSAFDEDDDDDSRKMSGAESSVWTTTLTTVDSNSIEY